MDSIQIYLLYLPSNFEWKPNLVGKIIEKIINAQNFGLHNISLEVTFCKIETVAGTWSSSTKFLLYLMVYDLWLPGRFQQLCWKKGSSTRYRLEITSVSRFSELHISSSRIFWKPWAMADALLQYLLTKLGEFHSKICIAARIAISTYENKITASCRPICIIIQCSWTSKLVCLHCLL